MIMREGLRTNKINNKIIMNNIFANQHKYSFPYFAGWADGDGSFVTKTKSSSNKNFYQLYIVNEEPIYQLSNLYQSAVLLATPEKRKWMNAETRKITVLRGQRLIHFCKKVAPFLIEKQYKALEILRDKEIKDYNCSYMQHTREEFIQYLAGFLEAEGHFMYKTKPPSYGFQVHNYCANVIKFIVDNLKKLFDIDVNFKVKKSPKMSQGPNGKVSEVGGVAYVPRQKEFYSITCGGQKGMPVFKEILPYMTIDYKIDAVKKIINHNYSRKKNDKD